MRVKRSEFELEVEKLIRSGLTREEASRRARLALGGLDQVKEECRDARGVSGLETAMQDLRYGMRGLRRNPGLAILATVTLSVGMAASTVVFSIFQAALLRPLPFSDADRVVVVRLPWHAAVRHQAVRLSHIRGGGGAAASDSAGGLLLAWPSCDAH